MRKDNNFLVLAILFILKNKNIYQLRKLFSGGQFRIFSFFILQFNIRMVRINLQKKIKNKEAEVEEEKKKEENI